MRIRRLKRGNAPNYLQIDGKLWHDYCNSNRAFKILYIMLFLICFLFICFIPVLIVVMDITDSDIARYKANKSVYRIKTKKDGKYYPQFKWFILWITMYDVGFVRNKQ